MPRFVRLLKIRLLVIVSCLLFFPFTLMADLTEAIRSALRNNGWAVLSMEDLPILTPSSDMTFEIRNLSRLKAGEAALDISLFHAGEAYAEVSLPVRLGTSQTAGESLLPPPLRESTPECFVKTGDEVVIVYSAKGFMIRSPGRALSCCRKGEETEVLNLAFNVRVRGVAADGRRIILK